jgi:hypothetical protein
MEAMRVGTTRNLSEKPTEWRVRGENDPTAIDLTPNLLDLTWPRVAVPTTGKSPTMTEIPPVRHVHKEEGPKTLDLHPKKQKPRHRRGGQPQTRQRQNRSE